MLKEIHCIDFLKRLETINTDKFFSSPNHGDGHFLGILGLFAFNIVPLPLKEVKKYPSHKFSSN